MIGKLTLLISLTIASNHVSIVLTDFLEDEFLLVTDTAASVLYQLGMDGNFFRKLDLNITSQVPVAIDYEPEEQLVYWTDINNHAIWRGGLDGKNQGIVIQLSSKASPEGVAVDPVADLLFFTDQGEDRIAVSRRDGSDVHTVIRTVLNPRTIRLDPKHRQFYWADWGKNTIERANYDGTDRQVIYKTDTSWINGLELDLYSRRVYWVDAYTDLVQAADMDGGGNLQVILNASATHPNGYNGTINPHFYGIALDDKHIYITDWDRKGVFSARKNGSDFRYLHGSLLVASGLVVFKSSRYTRGNPSHCNDVLNHNAGCSNLCLPTSASVVCACPDTQRLADDDKRCLTDVVALGPDIIWLEHDKLATSYIMGMHGDPAAYLAQRKFGERWSVRSPLWHWTAVASDYRNNKLFMADRADNLIVQLSMTSNLTIEIVHSGTSAHVNGITVDWISHNIYWTDSLFNWIRMARAVVRTPVTRTVVSNGLDQPHGICVWPQKGLLLWTDWGAIDKIEGSSLSGSNRHILVDSDLNKPTGLTIDHNRNKIYWCNSDSIEEMNPDGSSRRRLGLYHSANFIALTNHNSFIFATDHNEASASFKLWILNTADLDSLYPRLLLQRPPFGITTLSRESQPPATDVCKHSNCSQLCVTSADMTSQCLCGDGYDLDEDGITCKANYQTFMGPAIIYSLGDRLCAVSMQAAMNPGTNPDMNCFFVDGRYSFRALDYHYSTGHIYFSEVQYQVHSIRRAHMRNMTDNMAVIQGTGEVKGLAVDYIAGNLYWTDYTHGQVWISKLDGNLQKVLVTGLLNPVGIAIDQVTKKLYWSEQGNDTDPKRVIAGSIQAADLDGSNRHKLDIPDVMKPGGISLDPISGRLYWVDEKKGTIEHVRPDRPTESALVDFVEDRQRERIYDVAVFQDYYVYSQSGSANRSGVRIVESDSKQEVNSNLLHRLQSNAYDVIVFSQQNQAVSVSGNVSVSCSVENGGCAQLCVQRISGHVCLCVDGMRSDPSDVNKCIPNKLRKDKFFLVADDYRYQIYQLGEDLANDVISSIVLPSGDRPIALAYDFEFARIYWTDFNSAVIKSSSVEGSDVTVVFVGGLSSRIDGLAFDQESRLLYYTDTGLGHIGVVSPSGSYSRVLVNKDINNPRAIVLDPLAGFMYYTVREAAKGRIERRDLTGHNPLILVDIDISWPNGLDIDFSEGQMYWIDAHSETMEASDLLGRDRRTVYSRSGQSDPFGLAVSGGHVYWTDWAQRGIFNIDKHGGNISSTYGGVFRGLNDIKFFNKTALRGPNACTDNKAGCSHFCLSAPGGQRLCACPTGFSLDSDQRTCINVPTCSGEVPNGQMNSACSMEFDSRCDYVCHNGYTKTRRTPLRCTDDLTWDADMDTLCSYTVCPLLLAPHHATVNMACSLVGVPGTSCVHKCDFGYMQAGGDMRRNCTEDKTWSGSPLLCIAVRRCTALLQLPGTDVMPSSCTNADAVIGQICERKCSPGYVPLYSDGPINAVHVCLDTTVWNGTELSCVPGPTVTSAVQAKSTLTIPVIIGIAVACVAIVIIIIVVAILVSRKRKNQIGRFRNTSNIVLETNTPASDNHFHYGQETNGNSPKYNARTDSVDLSFENSAYQSIGDEIQKRPTPKKRLSQESAILETDRVSFDNPLYVKNRETEDEVMRVDRELRGSSVQPDLTRELSSA